MAQLTLDIDAETYQRIVEGACSERRPIVWQAEVMLRRAAGLSFPYDPAGVLTESKTAPSSTASAVMVEA